MRVIVPFMAYYSLSYSCIHEEMVGLHGNCSSTRPICIFSTFPSKLHETESVAEGFCIDFKGPIGGHWSFVRPPPPPPSGPLLPEKILDIF